MVFLRYEWVVDFPVFSPFFFPKFLNLLLAAEAVGMWKSRLLVKSEAAVENCLLVFHGRGISIASPFSPAAFAQGTLAVDLGRCLVLKRLMRPLVVIKVEVSRQARRRLPDIGVFL